MGPSVSFSLTFNPSSLPSSGVISTLLSTEESSGTYADISLRLTSESGEGEIVLKQGINPVVNSSSDSWLTLITASGVIVDAVNQVDVSISPTETKMFLNGVEHKSLSSFDLDSASRYLHLGCTEEICKLSSQVTVSALHVYDDVLTTADINVRASPQHMFAFSECTPFSETQDVCVRGRASEVPVAPPPR